MGAASCTSNRKGSIMFATLARFIYHRRWAVLVAAVLFMVLSGVYGSSVFGKLKGGGFDDPGSESSKVAGMIAKEMGHNQTPLIVLFSAKDGLTVSDPLYQQAVAATLAKVQGQPGVGTITSYYETGAPQLLSADKRSTYAVVNIEGGLGKALKLLPTLRQQLKSERLEVRLGGTAPINEEISAQVEKDLGQAELYTFPLVALLLLLIFGSLVAATLPLAIGGLAILGAFLLVRVLTEFTDVSVFAINVITMLGLGLAIDYSLFMISRFREELSRQQGDVRAALVRTMQTAGRTVLFSGLTVALSLLSLQVFPIMFLRSMSTGSAAAVIVAVLASLTVLPALLAVLGPRVNALSLNRLFRRQSATASQSDAPHGFWYKSSAFVMRYPTAILVVTLGLLLFMGSPFLRASYSTPGPDSLPVKAESRVVFDALQRDFPANETAPIQIVVRSDAAATSPASLASLYDYTTALKAVSGVRQVESLVTVDPRLASKEAISGFYASIGTQSPLAEPAATAAARYAKDNYSLVSIIYDGKYTDQSSRQLVADLRALPPIAGLSTQVGGSPAYLVDLLASLESHIPLALGFIILVIFVILFLMLGSLFVPLKAVLLNILSLSVCFGALVWVFQDGRFTELLNYTPNGTIDATQMVLIFAIAFGLSMDYEVFLLSRIKENYDRSGDNTAAVALGVQKTGAIITSAALLLVVVIGAFATGEILFIKQIGVGLALAILVDATLVRLLLVPATMRLMGKYNWWSPAPLTALYNRLGLGEKEEVPAAQPSSVKVGGQPEMSAQ